MKKTAPEIDLNLLALMSAASSFPALPDGAMAEIESEGRNKRKGAQNSNIDRAALRNDIQIAVCRSNIPAAIVGAADTESVLDHLSKLQGQAKRLARSLGVFPGGNADFSPKQNSLTAPLAWAGADGNPAELKFQRLRLRGLARELVKLEEAAGAAVTAITEQKKIAAVREQKGIRRRHAASFPLRAAGRDSFVGRDWLIAGLLPPIFERHFGQKCVFKKNSPGTRFIHEVLLHGCGIDLTTNGICAAHKSFHGLGGNSHQKT